MRLECERYAILRDSGAISSQEYDRQSAQCATQTSSEAAARARLADAVRVLDDAAIRAPFAGVIAERFVNVGDYVQPSSKVVVLLDDDPLRLRISVPEQAIAYAREGASVTFRTRASGDRDRSATIRYVGREMRPVTRDVIVEALLDNRERTLFPGAFVVVSLPAGSSTQAVVPETALVAAEGGSTVFTISNGKVQRRAIRTGVRVEGGFAVSDGLKKGERVVVAPPAGLQDGVDVE